MPKLSLKESYLAGWSCTTRILLESVKKKNSKQSLKIMHKVIMRNDKVYSSLTFKHHFIQKFQNLIKRRLGRKKKWSNSKRTHAQKMAKKFHLRMPIALLSSWFLNSHSCKLLRIDFLHVCVIIKDASSVSNPLPPYSLTYPKKK